jgi:UDPglucose 6-dehydrogenase
MRVGVVGHGVIGSAIARMVLQQTEHSLVIYDKFQAAHRTSDKKDAINGCDLVMLSVPTPTGADGLSCDLSAVEESVRWISAPLCIRSTIPPGTVDRLSAEYERAIAFSPEYIGESQFHPWRQEGQCGFLIVGGPASIFEAMKCLYQSCVGPGVQYYHTEARVAELCKYMENCFLATKVAFVNQFHDIAQAFQIDFGELRDLWLADPRIGESHTLVTEERGFRGRCLPKDIAAIVAALRPFGGAPLLEAVMEFNASVCRKADEAVTASRG